MAVITKKYLSEQALRRINSGDRGVGAPVHIEEVQAALSNAINSVLKTQFFGENLSIGETIPTGCVLANYAAVAVTSWNGISKSTLPVIPIKLPRDMGVYRISKTADPMQSPFIPIPSGSFAMVAVQRLIDGLLDQTGYEVRGKEIYYTIDLPAQAPTVTSVNMQLVVNDMDAYSDYEMLPLNADLADLVLDAVVAKFSSPVPPTTADPSHKNIIN